MSRDDDRFVRVRHADDLGNDYMAGELMLILTPVRGLGPRGRDLWQRKWWCGRTMVTGPVFLVWNFFRRS